MLDSEGVLLLSHLSIQNANAISSPLLWGFPGPTAFLGFVHALHRKVEPELGLGLNGVAIICHRLQSQTSKPSGKRTEVFHLSRNPVGSDGKSAALVEEGRIHLEVSLLIGVSGAPLHLGLPLKEQEDRIAELIASMRLAGGSLLPHPRSKRLAEVSLHAWPGSDDDEERLMRRLRRRLLPGFALVSRESLLEQRLKEMRDEAPEASSLDAFLDLSSLNIDPPTTNEDGSPSEWHVRKKNGWIVPISTGFRAISDLYDPGVVKNARDRVTPFRFVEGIYTMGEWKSPHRIDDLRQLMWTYEVDQDDGLYRCTTPHFSNIAPESEG